MDPNSEFEIPQLPAEFVREMRNDSISDAEYARSVRAVLDESSGVLRFMFYVELSSRRPTLFERLAINRLQQEESRNIGFLLLDVKNEEVSTDRFTHLFLMLCDPDTGEYRDNPEILALIYGLSKLHRPSIHIVPVAVMTLSSKKRTS